MRSAGLSDRGLVREENEDAFVVSGSVAAVADGMGGHQAGGLASQTALAEFTKTLCGPLVRPTASLQKAFSRANSAVRQISEKSGGSGMGATLTAIVIKDKRAWVGHIGDSRAYLLREGKLTQLTEDHSLVADLLRSGNLSPREAKVHPRRNVITKAVGSHSVIKPDVFSINLLPGDRLILCTDGLTNHVGDAQLAEIAAQADLDSACRRLVETAKQRGGSDNITVVIVEPEAADGARAGLRGRRALAALLAAAAIFAAAALASIWLNQSFYLTTSGKYVAVGRGLPAEVAGYKLGRVERATTIRADRLPQYYRRRLSRGLVVGGAPRLGRLLADLRELSGQGGPRE